MTRGVRSDRSDLYRHHCGRMVSLHDTEPCACEARPETPETKNGETNANEKAKQGTAFTN